MPEPEVLQLKAQVEALEKLVHQHLGPQGGAVSTKVPHPELSAAANGAYTVTNGTADRSYDADASSTAELADVLYTLITDLQEAGILG